MINGWDAYAKSRYDELLREADRQRALRRIVRGRAGRRENKTR